MKRVVKLREHRHRRQSGLLIAEGQREISRAITAGLEAESVYFAGPQPPAWLSDQTSVWDHLLQPVSDDVMAKMSYHHKPEGVLAVFHQPSPTQTLPNAETNPLVLVAVGTEKPGNLGAMARTAQAAGATALLAAGSPIDRFNPNAIRSSTGAVFSLPILSMPEPDAIDQLKTAGYRVLAATPHAAHPHHQAGYDGPTAIVIGPEDTGLSEAWLQAADERVVIPMANSDQSTPPNKPLVDSLNASVSAGILLFEAVRQRTDQTHS